MRVVGTRIPTVGEDRKFYSTADSTATAGQTAFAVNYDEGKVAVWLNGIRLVQGQDFTYTASGVGSQITLSSGIVANDYVEVVGYQGIYSGNALVEDRFVVGTSSTGSGGSYTNSTTVFPVASNTGDLVCVYRNGIKLVHTTDFTVQPTASTVTLQSASNTADEITVHVIGILQHSNFVPTSGGTFTGTVAHTGTLDVSGGTLTTSTAQKDAIVDGSTAIARSGNNLTFAGNITIPNGGTIGSSGDADAITIASTGKISTTSTNAGTAFEIENTNGSTNYGLFIKGGTSSSNAHYALGVNNSADSAIFRVMGNGNVGIGTTSPSESLTSRGNIFIETNSTSANSGGGLFWQSTTSGWNTTSAHAGIYGKRIDASNGYLRFDTRQSGTTQEAMRIDSSGNVGIGTDSPSKQLTVYQNNASLFSTLLQNNGTGTVELRLAPSAYPNEVGSTARWSSIRAINGGTGNPTALAFMTNGVSADPSERMRIDSSGHVIAPYGVTLGTAVGTYSASNTIDDYEEGTWTPILLGSGNPAGTYGYDTTRTNGTYTKIGNQVFVRGVVRVNSTTTAGTGEACIGGLPFAPSTSDMGSFSRVPYPLFVQGGPTLSYPYIFAAVENTNNRVHLYYQDYSSSTSNPVNINIADADKHNALWCFTAHYTTA